MRRKDAIGVRDVADDLGVDLRTVRTWIQTGRLRAAQPFGDGGHYRIPASEVQRIWDEIKGKE